MKAALSYIVIFVCVLIGNVNAQYPGYGKYQRDWEAQQLIKLQKQQKEEQENYYRSLPIDSVFQFEIPTKRENDSLSVNQKGCRITINNVRAKKEIKIPNGYTFQSATVYFTGTGFPVPYVVTIETTSLLQIDTTLNKCGAGSTVIFDHVKLTDKEGREYLTGKAYVVTTDDIKIHSLENYPRKELYDMLKHKFTRGIIYFAKAGFPVAQSIPATEINTAKGQNLLDRTMPGTEVTFDNCSYFDKEKKVGIIVTKIIKL